jgi:hypothetical protein
MYWLLLQAVCAFFLIYVTQPILLARAWHISTQKIYDKKSGTLLKTGIEHAYLLYIYKHIPWA